MDDSLLTGTISFVQHDRQYASIEYEHNGKTKSVNFKTGDPGTSEVENEKPRSKEHAFRIGDQVQFRMRRTDRGDKMMAYDVRFLFNQELEKLVNRSLVENRYSGYLKEVDGELFVKEWESYLFFPLKLSPWENPPAPAAFNEAISFRLQNLDKSASIVAELFSHDFIPEYRHALEYFKNKKPVDAVVARVSEFAIYLNLLGSEKLQAKLKLPFDGSEELTPGASAKLIITYISTYRLVVAIAD